MERAPAEDQETSTVKKKSTPKGELFHGKTFLLTTGDLGSLGGLPQFSEREMSEKLTKAGGVVVDDVTKIHDTANAFLIADRPYRTYNYVAALARKITCVHFQWVNACIDKKTLISEKNYVLEAGISFVDGLQIRMAPREPSKLLAGKTVAVRGSFDPENRYGEEFVVMWAKVVEWMGGTIVAPIRASLLVVGPHHDPNLVETMRDRAVPVVSYEYLIQCILSDEVLPVDCHEAFKPKRKSDNNENYY